MYVWCDVHECPISTSCFSGIYVNTGKKIVLNYFMVFNAVLLSALLSGLIVAFMIRASISLVSGYCAWLNFVVLEDVAALQEAMI